MTIFTEEDISRLRLERPELFPKEYTEKPVTLVPAHSSTIYAEQDFQRQVIDFLHKHNWRVAHFRPARTSKGWRTAVGADGAGFPDLCCVNATQGRVMFVELKSETGGISLEQAEWLLSFGKCPGIEVHVIKPSNDWQKIIDKGGLR